MSLPFSNALQLTGPQRAPIVVCQLLASNLGHFARAAAAGPAPDRPWYPAGQLYIDPAEGRRWLEPFRADPRARVRFGGRIYPLQAVLVGRPGELEGFDPTRSVYRLEPRTD